MLALHQKVLVISHLHAAYFSATGNLFEEALTDLIKIIFFVYSQWEAALETAPNG